MKKGQCITDDRFEREKKNGLGQKNELKKKRDKNVTDFMLKVKMRQRRNEQITSKLILFK